tara:strand:+ start:21246 stop:21647 length:402 start_codon:yes stop_codon:yes gene_type:complete
MKIKAYLAFDGNCEQALNFYANLFDANITNKQTYKDSKKDIPENFRSKLEHAELKGNGIDIMAYDASPDTPLTSGNNIHMSIDMNDKEKATSIFEALSKGGRVHYELRERDWGALYGRCTDQYNIQWMINCTL